MTPTLESLAADVLKLERRVSALESPNASPIEPKTWNGGNVASKPEPKRRSLMNVGAGPAAHEIQKRFPWMTRAAQLPPGEVHPMLGLRNQGIGVRSMEVRESARRNAREKVKRVVDACVTKAGHAPRYVYLDELQYGNSMMRNPLYRFMVEDHAGADDIVHTQLAIHEGMREGLSELGIVCDAILGMPEGMKSVDAAELGAFVDAAATFQDKYGTQIMDSGLTMGLGWSYMGLAAYQWPEGLMRQCCRSMTCRIANECAWGVPFRRCFANTVFGNRGGVATVGDVDGRTETEIRVATNAAKGEDRPVWNREHMLSFRDATSDTQETIGIWYNGNGDEEQYALETVPEIIEVMAEV